MQKSYLLSSPSACVDLGKPRYLGWGARAPGNSEERAVVCPGFRTVVLLWFIDGWSLVSNDVSNGKPTLVCRLGFALYMLTK